MVKKKKNELLNFAVEEQTKCVVATEPAKKLETWVKVKPSRKTTSDQHLLALLAWLLRRMDNALGWAVFSGIYGLCFGGLCAAVYLVAKTPAFALSWWLSGLSYDAMHGVGNFVIMLLLYRPLRRALQTAKRQLRVN